MCLWPKFKRLVLKLGQGFTTLFVILMNRLSTPTGPMFYVNVMDRGTNMRRMAVNQP